MNNSLPVLQVVVPLLSAIVCSLLKNTRLVKIISVVVVLISFSIAVVLFYQVYPDNIIKYSIGGWMVPYGIELEVSILNSSMLVLVNFVAFISVIYGIYPNMKEVSINKVPNFYSIFLLCFTGFLGILVSNDAFNIYVFLEISSICSYVLVAIGKDKTALVAAFDYLVIGTIGATFYLIGIGFLYAITGTLNVGDLFSIIQDRDLGSNKALQVGMLFIIIGLFIKTALFPFHKWLIQSYSSAPTFISVFFSGVSTKVMLYLLIKVVYKIFNVELMLGFLPFNIVFMFFASLSILLASIFAVFSNNIKRIFAYSSVAHLGYIIFALGLNTYYGLVAAVTYIIHHSLVKSALFMVIGSISYHYGSLDVKDCVNVWKSMPRIALPFVILCMSLIGIPITSGFISKLYIFDATIKSGFGWGIVILLIGSIISVVYMWKVIEATCFKKSSDNEIVFNTPHIMTLCIWIMVISSIILGVYPMPLMLVSNKIASFLS